LVFILVSWRGRISFEQTAYVAYRDALSTLA